MKGKFPLTADSQSFPQLSISCVSHQKYPRLSQHLHAHSPPPTPLSGPPGGASYPQGGVSRSFSLTMCLGGWAKRCSPHWKSLCSPPPQTCPSPSAGEVLEDWFARGGEREESRGRWVEEKWGEEAGGDCGVTGAPLPTCTPCCQLPRAGGLGLVSFQQ